MSETYIGPFGRILPVAYRPDSSEEDESARSITQSQPAMTATPVSAAPRLPLPHMLQFGSDPRPSFSDPQRYGTVRAEPQWSPSSQRPPTNQTLPPVSQLLSPTSPTGRSPFSHGAAIAPPLQPGNGHPSPHGTTYTSSYTQPESSYFSNSYNATSQYSANRVPSSHGIGAYDESGSRRLSSPTAPLYSMPPGHAGDRKQSHSSTSPVHGHYPSHSSEGSRGSESSSTRQELRTVDKPVMKCIGEDNIPGEGLCYLYEDGSRVRKEIDGESVNAQWGVTKAGKPRKRLAIACITCREKKIKCEPAEPKCVQCDKSGKECRFQTAVRNYIKEPKTPSYDQQAYSQATIDAKSNSMSEDSVKSGLSTIVTTNKHVTTCDNPSTLKRFGSINSTKEPLGIGKRPRQMEDGKDTTSENFAIRNISPVSLDDRASGFTKPSEDPYKSQPEITLHYMDLYFANFNAGRYNLFPERAFKRWLKSNNVKSDMELMVLYSMLAIGTIYSEMNRSKDDGLFFSKLTNSELIRNQGNYTLHGVQSGLMLSYYYFCIGEYPMGWEICGTAFRVAIALKMHMEPSKELEGADLHTFGFSSTMVVELYRRAFWHVYMVDRFQGFCLDHICVIQKEDVFLRLPCDDESYETGSETKRPYFDNGVIDTSLLSQKFDFENLSSMTYLIGTLSLAGEVLQQAHRAHLQSSTMYESKYEEFYQDITTRLHAWYDNLPEIFRFSEKNMQTSILRGYNDTFVATHTMFYLIFVILNCQTRRTLLSEQSQKRNANSAFHYSKQILSLLKMLLQLNNVDGIEKTVTPRTSLASTQARETLTEETVGLRVPFIGHAVYYACDIVSCAGSLKPDSITSCVEDLSTGLKISECLAKYFAIAKGQCKVIAARRQAMIKLQSLANSDMVAWRFESRMQLTRSDEMGLFYGVDASRTVFEILQLEADSTSTIVI